jgi:hypothetical protein
VKFVEIVYTCRYIEQIFTAITMKNTILCMRYGAVNRVEDY